MNRELELKRWRRTVRHHKRLRLLWWLWDKIGYRFQYLGWPEPGELFIIPMKPKKGEENLDSEYWSGYYTPEEMVDTVLPYLSKRGRE